MISLLQSERFQNEYNSFKTKIATITDKRIQSELESLLASLVSEVSLLDVQHREIASAKNLVTTNNDIKGKIAEIRKKIDSKLADCKRAGILD